MKKVLIIIGARPQFIKHFALELAAKNKMDLVTIHTGQHFDENMSQIFFDQLKMQKPNYLLKNGGGNHGAQTGRMMIEIEEIVINEKPDIVVVYGDTNSTLAGAIVASKLQIPLAHIEAGLRSYNKEMPEEINRVLTDHISDYLFVPSQISTDNLRNEGIQNKVYEVGDIMKDLVLSISKDGNLSSPNVTERYYYATLHRPYNTDEKQRLQYVLAHLNSLDKKVVFSIHPRTRIAMQNFGMEEKSYPNIEFIDPQGYITNLSYLVNSDGLITDSGGMQKEAYWLEKICVTIRKETEWVETMVGGCNTLVFEDLSSLQSILKTENLTFDINLYGDGNTASKIVSKLAN